MARKAIPELLDLMEQYDTQSIFFVTGEFSEYNPDLVDRIDEAGHELGVHTHPQLHPEFTGDHINDIEAAKITDYQPDDIQTMIGRDYDKLREIGIETDHYRSAMLDFDITVARQLKDLGLYHDHSIRMAISKDITNIGLYRTVTEMGLEETPVVLNPAFIHREEHNRLKPYHYVFATLFGGTLNLHPMTFGNKNIDVEDDFSRFEEYVKRCTHGMKP
jgi:peptidoglycan/xylan/chitin deacetylase (PgdA/CDA1 family)